MLFSVDQVALSQVLQPVSRAVAARTTLPVLEGVLVTASQQGVTIAATDLEIGIECHLPAIIEKEGSVILPARYFVELVKRLPAANLSISLHEANNTVEIVWGKSQYIIHGLPAEQFPSLVKGIGPETFSVAGENLREMIRRTIFAVSHDDARPILNGVLFELKGENQLLNMVSTDGIRLACCVGEVATRLDQSHSFILSARAMAELVRLCPADDDVKVWVNENHAIFQLGGLQFMARLLEGRFPDYKQVLPQEFSTSARLDTESFLASCERAALLSRKGNINPINLHFTDELLAISAETPEVGRVHEEMAAVKTGDDLSITFNARYLVEGLRALEGEETIFEATGPYGPSCLRPVQGSQSYFYLVLPLRTG